MDLSVHSMKDEQTRTIFEDAENFAKDYSYKLMPITFESVNETIIHIEHNYCHLIQSDVQESNESCNGDVNEEVEDRNYDSKIRSLALDSNNTGKGYETQDGESGRTLSPGSKSVDFVSDPKINDDCGISAQPLDLSLPLVQEQKTDKTLTENQSNIPKIKSDAKNSPDKKQLNLHESNKENVTSPKKIEVTVSRPGQKGYYEPCEVFLNDLAKISPDLIKNDCREIEIIDRTHGQDFQQELGRTYYIVLESTWRIFEDSTERIILTNDLNIGQPVQHNDRHDKPRYLIFDQYSLTESLAKICESKGGSFEYTCLEEEKEQPKVRDNGKQDSITSCDDSVSDCLKGDVIFESESGRPEVRHSDTDIDEGGKENVPNDCATSLGTTNSVETSLEKSDDKVEVDEAETGQPHPGDPSCDGQFPEISEIPLVSEDQDPAQLENESEICDVESSTEPVRSGEPNLEPSELINASIESDEIEKKSNSGSASTGGATELVKEEKCASDVESVKTDNFAQSERKRTKRTRISKKNSRAVSGKIKKLNASAKAENMAESEEVQRNSEDAGEQETTGEGPSPSPRSTRSRVAQPPGKEEAAKDGKEEAAKDGKEEAGKDGKEEAAKDGKEAAKDGKEEAAKDGKEEAAKDGKEEAAKDGKEEAAKDGKEEAAKDGKEEAAKDGKEEAAKDGKEEAGKDGKEEAAKYSSGSEEHVKVPGTGEVKRKSRGIKRKISRTDIKTRSSKEVSVLRSGKQRCAPPEKAKTQATAKRERGKADLAKISKQKSERPEEMSKTRARTRKTASEENKKICLRKRS